MAAAHAGTDLVRDPVALARTHAVLRFGTAVTAALIVSEAMQWQPTFLAPLLAAVLIASLPFSPPFKVGLALVAVMAASALVSFLLPSLLRGTPQVLFGAIGLIVFFAFATMAQGRAKLPMTLLLLCISTVPVIAMVYPAQAGVLPVALVRATAVAMLIVWSVHAVWPRVAPRAAPPPPAPIASPVVTALMGTAIVMPLMLVYLLLGLTDALPVLVTTVLLVSNLDPEQGETQGLAMIVGNFLGGFVGGVQYLVLQTAPSLVTLSLLTFVVALAIGTRIDKGGPAAAIGLIACNTWLIILSTALASGSTTSGIWVSRLLQFAFACTFAIGMMSLVWRRKPAVGN